MVDRPPGSLGLDGGVMRSDGCNKGAFALGRLLVWTTAETQGGYFQRHSIDLAPAFAERTQEQCRYWGREKERSGVVHLSPAQEKGGPSPSFWLVDPGPSRRDLEAELQRLELLTSRSWVRTFTPAGRLGRCRGAHPRSWAWGIAALDTGMRVFISVLYCIRK